MAVNYRVISWSSLESLDETDEGGGEAVVFQGLKQGPVRDTVESFVEIYVEAV